MHVRPVARADVPRLLHVVGNVKASATVGVKPRVTGVRSRKSISGKVRTWEGDPLIGIDPRPFEAALREKRGLLAKSQAQLSKANHHMRRYGKLVGGGYVSREAYEQTATEAAALKATVQSDKAAVESAALIFLLHGDRAHQRSGGRSSMGQGQYGQDHGRHARSDHRHALAHLCGPFPCPRRICR